MNCYYEDTLETRKRVKGMLLDGVPRDFLLNYSLYSPAVINQAEREISLERWAETTIRKIVKEVVTEDELNRRMIYIKMRAWLRRWNDEDR